VSELRTAAQLRVQSFLKGAINTRQEEIDYVKKVGFDWRKKNVELKIKDQRSSGSCISHAVTSAIEAYFQINQGKKTSWSALDLYYCVAEKDTRHFTQDVFEQLSKKGVKSSDCLFTKSLPVLKRRACVSRNTCEKPTAILTKYTRSQQNKFDIMHRIKNTGPVVMSMQWSAQVSEYVKQYSSRKGWKKPKVFKSEDYADISSDRTSADSDDDDDDSLHAILVLGYGFDNGKLYWIVQNSHGEDSGEKGIMYIAEGELEMTRHPTTSIEEVQLEHMSS
jgi:C1A family cysteine protease